MSVCVVVYYWSVGDNYVTWVLVTVCYVRVGDVCVLRECLLRCVTAVLVTVVCFRNVGDSGEFYWCMWCEASLSRSHVCNCETMVIM